MTTNWIPITERGPQVTEDAVRRFEERLGATLPQDYREFLLEVNGGFAPTSHCVFWLRKSSTILNSLYSLDDPDERSDLATRQLYPKYPKNDLPPNALKIGYDDGGSSIVLILSGPHHGEVWFLDTMDPRPEGSNPRVEWFDRRDVVKLANTFHEFIDSLRPLDAASETRTKA
jgi:SMI1 / KNR4 family (SUKH-1)